MNDLILQLLKRFSYYTLKIQQASVFATLLLNQAQSGGSPSFASTGEVHLWTYVIFRVRLNPQLNT